MKLCVSQGNEGLQGEKGTAGTPGTPVSYILDISSIFVAVIMLGATWTERSKGLPWEQRPQGKLEQAFIDVAVN